MENLLYDVKHLGCVGYVSLDMFPQLTGRPWDALAKAVIKTANPVCVQVAVAGAVLLDNAVRGRVTVRLNTDDTIRCVTMEACIDLPLGYANGHDVTIALSQNPVKMMPVKLGTSDDLVHCPFEMTDGSQSPSFPYTDRFIAGVPYFDVVSMLSYGKAIDSCFKPRGDKMEGTKMWELVTYNFFKPWRWMRPRTTPYTYDGNDGRRVIAYTVECGPIRFIRYRIAGTIKVPA